jgi:hypothetical protein
MRTFEYAPATDVASAVSLLAGSPTGTFLAGGTNLVDLMKLGVATPASARCPAAACGSVRACATAIWPPTRRCGGRTRC